VVALTAADGGDGFAIGNARGVVGAALHAMRGSGSRGNSDISSNARSGSGVLALVLETEGSTYAHAGAMAVFDGDTQVGWLSGGCLEPELARMAAAADAGGRVEWMEIDTRADDDLLSGSALGCRGRLRVALLPLRLLLDGVGALERWMHGDGVLVRQLHADGRLQLDIAGDVAGFTLAAAPVPWPAPLTDWRLPLGRAPEAVLLGGGPESPLLLQLLRALGWRTTLVEQRQRWQPAPGAADVLLATTPARALAGAVRVDAALAMHHHFELDREALAALAVTDVAFVGLLGPRRRRDDLFKLLPAADRDALAPRLRSPVGLDLGGSGAEAIALSIAAQLQAWRTEGARA